MLLDALQRLAARGELDMLQSRPPEPLEGIAFPNAKGVMLTVEDLRAAAERSAAVESGGRESYNARSRGGWGGSSWRDDERDEQRDGSVRNRLDAIRGRRSPSRRTGSKAGRNDAW